MDVLFLYDTYFSVAVKHPYLKELSTNSRKSVIQVSVYFLHSKKKGRHFQWEHRNYMQDQLQYELRVNHS